MKFSGCQIEAWSEEYPINGVFRISRDSRKTAQVVVCRVICDGHSGVAECVPYPRYGESVESVLASIKEAATAFNGSVDGDTLDEKMRPGAARNALDCALWDLRAKMTGRHAHTIACTLPPRPVETAFTISLDDPDRMSDAARAASSRPVLKIKLGGNHDIAAMHAVSAAAPNSRIIIDANEAWTPEALPELMREAAGVHIALIEQPLPATEDAFLHEIPHSVPICADESAHTTDDLESLRGRYDIINIKLDKAGGLTEALKMRNRARELGFGVMIGCMVGTSLSMAPAVLLAQDADYVDLDGPLLLANDRTPALRYAGNTVSPPRRDLWG
ncbi:N-acetyl-D-Glu racemase DgcA [Oricola cellulosilytica]|uniref:Dipeptide epimerase n=1 Tax=Oricola cellulosilytica TaxID=1429082 RepID=A0A4V2MN99_9HYPH|nr:N-acetyl-D-Glu racemase DgcA [Oricola cellulosilytica]TCD11968.1 dipeptide epimerase [Oricola cellulosilytica]